jgi:hypothetical protein
MRQSFFSVCLLVAGCAQGVTPEDDRPGGFANPGGNGGPGDPGSASGGQPGTETASCGGTVCRSGSTCVMNRCEYTCTGVRVPGDYATIQEAATAIQTDGGTICLSAKTYTESVSLSPQKPLTLVGLAESATIIEGGITLQGDELTLRGITVRGTSSPALRATSHKRLTIESCTFRASSSSGTVSLTSGANTITSSKFLAETSGTALAFVAYAPSQSLTLENSDLAASSVGDGTAFLLSSPYSTSTIAKVEVKNSYFHNAKVGLSVSPGGASRYLTADVLLVNNTFERLSTGVDYYGAKAPSYYNNIVTECDLGISINASTSAPTNREDHGNNVMFKNTANFGGFATPGLRYLTTDPMLDTSKSPPAPKAGSPTVGAGDTSKAPPKDFWGKPRGPSVDIGAVEF